MPNSHEPVYRAKGIANKYRCIDCGDKASDWSRIHDKPIGYPDSYVPRCHDCHVAYDMPIYVANGSRNAGNWTTEQRKAWARAKWGNPEYRAAVTAQWTAEKREAKRQETIAKNKLPISDERRRNLSESHKGKPSPRKGAKLTDEQKAKISRALTGRKDSPETRKRKSQSALRRTRGR